MPNSCGRGRFRFRLGVLAAVGMATFAAAETVTLKTGVVYRGIVDKDNTIVSIFDPDGTKRIILRDSKVARTEPDQGLGKIEMFDLVQPLTVHGGAMPVAAYNVTATPWDLKGRRTFTYTGPRTNKPIEMEQAIIGLGPRICKIRGINGFWQSQVATSTVPKATLFDILGKVDQKLQNERLRVVRFLIQADLYAEAKVAVQRYKDDFGKSDPAVADQCKNAIDQIRMLEAQQALNEIEAREKAGQPRFVSEKLKNFPTQGAPAPILVLVRDHLRQDEARAAADKELIEALGRTFGEAAENKARLAEIVAALTEAPDAARPRLEAFEKARGDGTVKPSVMAALAISGWVAGSENAVAEADAAEALWTARDLARDYLGSFDPATRSTRLGSLEELKIAGKPLNLETLGQIVRLMAPPLRDLQTAEPGKPKEIRVRDEFNPE